jgi:hypothetical protein
MFFLLFMHLINTDLTAGMHLNEASISCHACWYHIKFVNIANNVFSDCKYFGFVWNISHVPPDEGSHSPWGSMDHWFRRAGLEEGWKGDKWMMNWNDLEGSGRGLILRYSVLSRNPPEGLRKNMKNLIQDNLSPDWYLNQVPLENEARVLTTRPPHYVFSKTTLQTKLLMAVHLFFTLWHLTTEQ